MHAIATLQKLSEVKKQSFADDMVVQKKIVSFLASLSKERDALSSIEASISTTPAESETPALLLDDGLSRDTTKTQILPMQAKKDQRSAGRHLSFLYTTIIAPIGFAATYLAAIDFNVLQTNLLPPLETSSLELSPFRFKVLVFTAALFYHVAAFLCIRLGNGNGNEIRLSQEAKVKLELVDKGCQTILEEASETEGSDGKHDSMGHLRLRVRLKILIRCRPALLPAALPSVIQTGKLLKMVKRYSIRHMLRPCDLLIVNGETMGSFISTYLL